MKATSVLLSLLAAVTLDAAPSIVFTYNPPFGTYADSNFQTEGVDPTKYGVTGVDDVFDTFWGKPSANRPIVTINADGSGSISLINAGSDGCAKKLMLFVVPLGSVFTVAGGETYIPADMQAMSIAATVVDRTPPAKALNISSMPATAKDTYDCTWGPGPNHFSSDNVWVDDAGKLHLRISYQNGAWRCAEVISDTTPGYGTYTFTVDSDLSKLPDQAVFGVFLYAVPDPYPQELDYEYSTSAVIGGPNSNAVTVQPYTRQTAIRSSSVRGMPFPSPT